MEYQNFLKLRRRKRDFIPKILSYFITFILGMIAGIICSSIF